MLTYSLFRMSQHCAYYMKLLMMLGMLQISWSAKHFKERNWHSCVPSLVAGVCFL